MHYEVRRECPKRWLNHGACGWHHIVVDRDMLCAFPPALLALFALADSFTIRNTWLQLFPMILVTQVSGLLPLHLPQTGPALVYCHVFIFFMSCFISIPIKYSSQKN